MKDTIWAELSYICSIQFWSSSISALNQAAAMEMPHDDWLCNRTVNMFYKYLFTRNVEYGETNTIIYSLEKNILSKPTRNFIEEKLRIEYFAIEYA